MMEIDYFIMNEDYEMTSCDIGKKINGEMQKLSEKFRKLSEE